MIKFYSSCREFPSSLSTCNKACRAIRRSLPSLELQQQQHEIIEIRKLLKIIEMLTEAEEDGVDSHAVDAEEDAGDEESADHDR